MIRDASVTPDVGRVGVAIGNLLDIGITTGIDLICIVVDVLLNAGAPQVSVSSEPSSKSSSL